MKKLILLFAWAFMYTHTYATHAAGADLTYECLGGNTYRFTLAFYRDCGGVDADNTYDIDLVANNCNGSDYDLELTLNPVGVSEITPLCPGVESNCGNGSVTGIQEYIYQGTITLPDACDNWTFTFCEAARNNIIDVIQAPGGQDLCVEATLDNLNAPCNSSPTFTNEPVGFVCAGTVFCFNHGTLDADGDSLAFTPIIPLNGPNGSTVNYINPFNVNNPLPTLPELPYSVDPISGNICFKPSQAIVSVIAIRIDEYRNGQLIGSVIRDIQLNVSNCNNQNPEIYGFDGQVASSTNTTTTECAGDQVSFVIDADDPDVNQNLSLSWNNAIPGATFTDNGNGTATFTWTSSPQDAGNTRCFTVTAEDDYCPYIGSFTTQFCIELIGGTLIVNGEEVEICGDMEVELEAQNGTVFHWNAINGDPIQVGTNFSCNPCQSPIATPTQTTEYVVNSDLNNGICTDKDTITVIVGENIGNMSIATNNDTLLCPDECVTLTQNGTVADTVITPITFDAQPNAVIDNWNDPNSTINVNGVSSNTVYPGSIASICFDIEHTFDADLDIYVECPNGTMLELTTDNGGGNDDYLGTCFTPTAVTPINFGFPPFNGNYIPEGGNIDTELAGCPTNGNWTLHVSDDANGHHGTLDNWSITFNDTVINSAPASNFEWTDGSGNVISNNDTHQICPQNNDFYVATIYDDMNCFIQDTVQVNVNPPMNIDANISPENCIGNNGSIDISVFGGVPPYSYNWITTGDQTEDINGLTSGDYIIEVTDASGAQCVKRDTFYVPYLDNTPVIDSVNITDESCIGLNDGHAIAYTSNGTPPLQYTINGNNNPNYDFNNLSDQNYEVIVTDDLGCDDTIQFAVAPGIDINYQSQSYIASCGDNNGAITITASGGTSYQYSIDDGQNFVSQDSFPNLSAGQYDIIVIDDISGCADSGIVNVNNSPAQVIDSIVTQPVSCNGGNDGSVIAYVSHGNPPVTYSLDNGQTTQNNGAFQNLNAGTYNLWTQDGFGCLALETFEIEEPNPINANISFTDVLCNNACDGSLDIVDTTGGNGMFTVNITGPNGSYTDFELINLCDGQYDITISDINNCTYNASVTVQEPQPLLVDVTTDSTTCFNGNDGSAQANVNGGTPPYQYLWSNNETQSNIQNLSSGNYIIQVTDDNGCSENANGNVDDATPMLFTNINIQDEVCYNACDGEINIVATQATQYFVNGSPQPNGLFSNLCPGNYDIVVKNQHGCQIDSSVTIESQNPIVIDPIVDTTICYNGQSDFIATVNGTSNGYSFEWYENNMLIHQGNQVSLSPNYQTSYEVIATDANGCTSDGLDFTVVVLPPLQVSAYQDTALCEGGEVSLIAYVEGGDGNYTYNWASSNQNTVTNQSFNYIANSSETWDVEVQDGCETPMTQDHVTITVHPNPNVNFTVEDPTVCIPEVAHFKNITDLNGTTTWSFGNGQTANGWDGAIRYERENCFDVTLEVTTSHGCYGSVTYNEIVCTKLPPVADFSYNPKEVKITEPTVDFFNQSLGAKAYWWSFGDGDTSIATNPIHAYTANQPGDYPVYLVATNEYGCTDTTLQTIHVEEDVLVFVPNAFTPDGNGRNDVFTPVVAQDFNPQTYTFYVFNRWGEVLFQSHNQQIGWDGTYRGQIVKQDVYVWQVSFKERDTDKKYEYRGHFTVLK